MIISNKNIKFELDELIVEMRKSVIYILVSFPLTSGKNIRFRQKRVSYRVNNKKSKYGNFKCCFKRKKKLSGGAFLNFF